MNHSEFLSNTIKDLFQQKESIILQQLDDLISRGLLVIEQTQPVLIREFNSTKITLQQSVKLTLKDKEYIEDLERENEILREQLLMFAEACASVKEGKK